MSIRGYSLNSWARTRHILRGRIKTTSWWEQTHHPRGIKTSLPVLGQGVGNRSYHTVILLVTDRHPRCGVSVILQHVRAAFFAPTRQISYTYREALCTSGIKMLCKRFLFLAWQDAISKL